MGTYYDPTTVRDAAEYLLQIGDERMPLAVGFARKGADSVDAYRSMLNYVGAYASEGTRYGMYTQATSTNTGLFKYSDAGVVDLTSGLLESFTSIDASLVSKGYISAQCYDRFLQAKLDGNASALAMHENPVYFDTVAKARLQAYYFDDGAPARFREGARAGAKLEATVQAISAGAEVAAVLPYGRIARWLSPAGEAAAAKLSSLMGIVSRREVTEGALDKSVFTLIPGDGMLANRKQLRDFFNEVDRLGYTVKIDEMARGASVSQRSKILTLNSERPDLSTMVDEYAHMWNKTYGRGRYLPDDLAKLHLEMEQQMRAGRGTSVFSSVENTLYHQLELANL
jgi:large repetitive protein